MVIRIISYVNTLLTGKIRLLAILGDETTVILNIAKRSIILMALQFLFVATTVFYYD